MEGWPFGEGEPAPGSIAEYMSQNKFDLVINLPTGARKTTPTITKGYTTRRMAVDYDVPLITDVKVAKLFVEVRPWHHLLSLMFYTAYSVAPKRDKVVCSTKIYVELYGCRL